MTIEEDVIRHDEQIKALKCDVKDLKDITKQVVLALWGGAILAIGALGTALLAILVNYIK